MASLGNYAYSSLGTSASFRVLVLFPEVHNNPESPLRGTLETHDEGPSETTYEIISYVWGSEDLTHVIYIGDKVLRITANLHAALMALRLKEYPKNLNSSGSSVSELPCWGNRVIWADGICIDQKDALEKGYQVNHMGQYYQCAQRTIVHLGAEKDRSSLAEPLVRKIYSAITEPSGAIESTLPSKRPRQVTGLPVKDDPAWRALQALFLRPWWTRYWIIQEVIKGTEVLLLCGNWSLQWEVFVDVVRWASEQKLLNAFLKKDIAQNDAVQRGMRGLQNLSTMRNSMNQNRTLPTWTLIDLLERCQIARCTDERDYIYATLGLSMEAHGKRPGALQSLMAHQTMTESSFQSFTPGFTKDMFTADYNESVEDCYIRYARYMVHWGDGIKILYSSCHRGRRKGLPSWVPNWAASDLPWRTLTPKFDRGPDPWYCAGGKTQPWMRLSTLSDHLDVRGIMFDIIKNVGHLGLKERQPTDMDPEGVLTRDMRIVEAFANDLQTFLKKTKPRLEDPVLESIWRVLCCDLDGIDVRSPASPSLGLDLQPTLIYAQLLNRIHTGQALSASQVLFLEQNAGLPQRANNVIMRCAPMCLGKRPMVTESGWIGLVPGNTEAGDVIFLPLGSTVPIVLRMEMDGCTLIGDCFVDGIMRGELVVENKHTEVVTVM